jgi:hypothetical protein
MEKDIIGLNFSHILFLFAQIRLHLNTQMSTTWTITAIIISKLLLLYALVMTIYNQNM